MNSKKIVILPRGLTFIGDLDLDGSDPFVKIVDAQCIIHWGTLRHVAELVHGPTAATALGEKRDVHVARAHIVAYYDCDEGKW